ncbi:hypothetical protein AB1Y20_022514 [Prymnesium parvum]|uniref:AAA+ ATPase domain-containing protein n=1 Tax=Prymnesium parvum TaxID=97485 RepID=A0AB34JH67_PRYPA
MAEAEDRAALLQQFRAVVGAEAPQSELEELLHRADHSLPAAINAFFERPRPTDPPAPKRRAIGGPTAAAEACKPPVSAAQPREQAAAPPSRSATRERRPLAERMRPMLIEHLVGQDAALNSVLVEALQRDALPSLLLWGPPGSGKTSFASVIAATTRQHFRAISAAKAGVAEVRDELSRAAGAARLGGKGTILFVDEIHRWSKAQQDALLMDCERGTVTLIGATTENPSFSLNKAILSRCRLLVFEKLPPAAIRAVVLRAVASDGALSGVRLADDAIDAIAAVADGDARMALGVLELAATGGERHAPIDGARVRAASQRAALYDRNGDAHYDLISAVHKALRGGSVDAALYYATRMLTAGEDPRYITRRLIRFASEDVGLADPQALPQAVAADQSVAAIGMPEAGVVIAQCIAYLALAPKSCAIYRAYNEAVRACKQRPHAPVPLHIRNAPTGMMKQLGYGEGYEYNPANGYVRGCSQGYLPSELGDVRFFDPNDCEPGHVLHFTQPQTSDDPDARCAKAAPSHAAASTASTSGSSTPHSGWRPSSAHPCSADSSGNLPWANGADFPNAEASCTSVASDGVVEEE